MRRRTRSARRIVEECMGACDASRVQERRHAVTFRLVWVLAMAGLISGAPDRAAAGQRGQGFTFALGEKHVETAFDVAAGSDLRIDMPEIGFVNSDAVAKTSVKIEVGAAGIVEVGIFFSSGRMQWARGIVRNLNLGARIAGQTVVIESPVDLARFEQPSWAHQINLFIEVRVPEGLDVFVSNAHGEIRVERLGGSAIVRSTTADVTIGNVRGGEVSISTEGGAIAVDTLDADTARVTAARSSIEIGTLRGEIYAATSEGDIRVRRAEGCNATLKSENGSIRFDIHRHGPTTLVAENGDISIHAPASIAADVHLEGDAIRVDEAFGLDARPEAKRFRGRINGGGPRLDAMASGGEVRLAESSGAR